MSKENYDALFADMVAIPKVNVQAPAIPVDVYNQEAEDLAVWVEGEEEPMTKAGLDWNQALQLPVRAGALRYAQSLWMKEFNIQEEARREWETKAPAAYELKNDLEADCRFAFRERPDLLAKVQQIEEGTGNADLIQDLSDLAELAIANQPLVVAVGVDPAKLQLAATTAPEMARLLALMNGETTSNSEAKVMRDRAYTYLKMAVNEVRDTGKYVFRKDPEKLKGFTSAYYRKLNRTRPADAAVDTTEGSPVDSVAG